MAKLVVNLFYSKMQLKTIVSQSGAKEKEKEPVLTVVSISDLSDV